MLYACTLGTGQKILVDSPTDPASPPHIQKDPITGQTTDVRNSTKLDVLWPTPYGIQALGPISSPGPGGPVPNPYPSPVHTLWVCQLETPDVFVQIATDIDPSNPAHKQPNPIYGGVSRIISARRFDPTRDSPGFTQTLGPLA